MSDPRHGDPEGSDGLDDLTPDLRALLAAEQQSDGMPTAATARLDARLAYLLVIAPGVSADGAGAGDGGTGAGSGAEVASNPGSKAATDVASNNVASRTAATAGLDASATKLSAMKLMAMKLSAIKLAPLAIAFVAGAGTGAAVYSQVAAPGDGAIESGMPLAPRSGQGSATTGREPEPPVAADALPDTPRTASARFRTTATGTDTTRPDQRHPIANVESPSDRDPSDRDLVAERNAIERARTALSRGTPLEAIAALDDHGQRFPQGRLREERDALRVMALVRLGRRAEASAAAAAFSRHFPRSLFRPVVEAAVASLSETEPPR